jgi:purine-nucleoside/S-methyl-5'-thioadenosine phosphorylase / adenosine deaminase
VNGEAAPFETFSALASLPEVVHGLTLRVPGIDVKADRTVALQRLDEAHAAVRARLGLGNRRLVFAEQVHGREVAIVDGRTSVPVSGTDGLITADRAVCLGVYAADCGAVFLVDPTRRVIALLHSGRKGTELGIATNAIRQMVAKFGCEPGEMVAQLGPCIRPPQYEVDFAAAIIEECRGAGITRVHDCNICTAVNLDRYYSYRAEKGQTGRMLALLALR